MVSPVAVRRWVMTGALTAITVVGSIYGAGLKGRQEFNEEKKRILEATPEERIAQLEAARTGLVIKKRELERKMAQASARRDEKERARKDAK